MNQMIKERNSQVWNSICSVTYSSYENASLRPDNEKNETSGTCNLYTLENLIPVLKCAMHMLLYIMCPYLLLLFAYFSLTSFYVYYSTSPLEENYWLPRETWMHFKSLSYQLVAYITASVAIVSHFYLEPAESPKDGSRGSPVYGATTAPGLYFTRHCKRMQQIIGNCKYLRSPAAVEGSLAYSPNELEKPPRSLSFTSWLNSGDIRTLVPFLTFRPKEVVYVRRWVRVPVAKGACDDFEAVCAPAEEQQMKKSRSFFNLADAAIDDGDDRFEAVALDCAFPDKWTERQKDRHGGHVALLLLSGLTGGSTEGYVMDMVDHARRRNWCVFVMTGRGLAGCPCRSEALFHGARTSDIVATAKAIRSALPPDTRLFLAGISLGAIIAANATAQGQLDGIIDGSVCISGCFDTHMNSTYKHSLKAWQPILNLPLKEAFVSPQGNMRKITSKVGLNTEAIMSNIHNISEFDASFITPLHGFEDCQHYYEVMSAGMKDKLKTLTIPLLAIHAVDDPILHVDTLPTHIATLGSLTESLVILITRTGGHVGWPVGWLPWLSRWVFQNSLTSEFIESVCDEVCASKLAAAMPPRGALGSQLNPVFVTGVVGVVETAAASASASEDETPTC